MKEESKWSWLVLVAFDQMGSCNTGQKHQSAMSNFVESSFFPCSLVSSPRQNLGGFLVIGPYLKSPKAWMCSHPLPRIGVLMSSGFPSLEGAHDFVVIMENFFTGIDDCLNQQVCILRHSLRPFVPYA